MHDVSCHKLETSILMKFSPTSKTQSIESTYLAKDSSQIANLTEIQNSIFNWQYLHWMLVQEEICKQLSSAGNPLENVIKILDYHIQAFRINEFNAEITWQG